MPAPLKQKRNRIKKENFHYPTIKNNCLIYKAGYLIYMKEKKSQTDNKQSISDNNEQELWFSALAANDSYVYNVDKAFDRFVSRTRQRRHKTFHMPKIVYGAAAVILLLIASTVSYWWGGQQLQNQFADILVEAPLGAKTKLVLPDSTLVWLNAGSKIVYSQGFGVKDRHLQLNGEAYFEVRKNEKLPFDVMTKELNVKVLGTKFNFRNYEEDEEVTVNLLEGKVQLENYVKKMGISYLSPSEKVTLNKLTGEMVISRAEVKNAKEWTNDGLFFDEMPLSDIVKELNRSYNVKIRIVDKQLSHNRFYALFNRKEQTIYNVLDIITATNQVKYKVEGDSILLYAK